jgi:hypothetical protein
MKTKVERQCGEVSKYRFEGCRCEVCTVAYTEYRKKYRPPVNPGFGVDKLPAKTLLEFVDAIDDKTIADALGIHLSRVRKWRTQNIGLHKFSADKYANRIGVHPSVVWGNDWYRIPFRDSEKD